LRHELHIEPDKSTRDDRPTCGDRSTHDNRYANDGGL
jgi:hypothetical protein